MASARMHIEVGVLCLALAAASWSGEARAEANGLKFGDGRVHPFFEIESRYDTAAVVTANSNLPSADLIMHFKPGLRLEMPSPKFAVNLDGALDYVLFTGLVSPDTQKYYSRPQGEANLDLGINRDGQYGFDLGDHFTRTDRVTDPTVGFGVLSLYNEARAQVNLRPSGGALDLAPNYHLTTEWFSSLVGNSSRVIGADYLTHTFALNGRWKFLPKTAITLDGAFAMRNYLGTATVGNTPINTLKLTAGLAGLLSTHLSTVLKVGWGHDFTANSFTSVPVIGQAELGYILSESGQIKLGFVRTFEPVSGELVSYTDNRIYLDARVLLAGRLTLRAAGSADFIQFNAAPKSSGIKGSGTNVSGDAGVDVEILKWLTLSGGYMATYRGTLSDLMRHEIYARVQFIY